MYRPLYNELYEKIQVGNDQENAHSKNRGGEKTKLTIRHIYVENISQAERTAISQQAAPLKFGAKHQLNPECFLI